MFKRIWKWLRNNEGLIWLVMLTVVLRIPSLFEPYWYGDEGIYLVLGQAFKKGLVFYRDIHDNKPPLLYLLAALVGNVFWFRALLMVWFSVGVGVFFRLMQVLLPKQKEAWYLSSILMILGTTMVEGNIANAEIFIVLPVVAGMLLAVIKQGWWWCGLLFSIGFLLKVPAGLEFGALLIWLFGFEQKRLKDVSKTVKDKRFWQLLGGFLGPIVISIAYYAKAGGLERYVRSALFQNIGYLSSWSTGVHSASGFATQSGLLLRGTILGLSLIGFYWLAKRFKLSARAQLVVVWFLMALFGALLSERPYPHYLIQPIVPGSILVSYFLFGRRKLIKLVVLGVSLLAGISYYQIKFWHYPVIGYYQNFIEHILGEKSKTEYRSFFDSRVNQSYELAKYIRQKTLPEERVFIWGDEPYVYALAERLPIGRYTVAYHIIDFDGYEEIIEAWDKYKPPIVVVMEYEKRKFPAMRARLGTDYLLVKRINKALVYLRIDGVE